MPEDKDTDKTPESTDDKAEKPGLWDRANNYADGKLRKRLFLGSVGTATAVVHGPKLVKRGINWIRNRGADATEKAVEAVVEAPAEEAAAEATAGFLGIKSTPKLW